MNERLRLEKQTSQSNWLPPLVSGLALAFVSLACVIGVLSPSDPIFTPPGGELQWTATPGEAYPTPGALPTLVSEDSAELVSSSNLPLWVTPEPLPVNTAPILYYTQAGDTLPVVAVRFGVEPHEMISPDPIPESALVRPNQLLIIPHRLANTTSPQKLLPDSEVVFSPSAADFDIHGFLKEAGGYMSVYREWLGSTQWTSGADIVWRVALENSINPRLLLALLEYQSGWVYGYPANALQSEYPMGKVENRRVGLYQQLSWAINQLSIGYYGWREGLLTEITFSDGVTARLSPELNAGTVALQYYFAQIYDTQGWLQALDPVTGLPTLHERMYGSPWLRAYAVEPLYPPDLQQPSLMLPFLIGQVWSYTGGPHGAWEHDGSRAALDFSPGRIEAGCVDSDAWVLASAPGLVVRSGNGVVVLDLDGDGLEQTGWTLLYLHIANKGRIGLGQWVERGDFLGYPSCEGGASTGTHIHVARKYNGEWISADGPLPFNLDGWIAHAGVRPYEGTLTRDGETITANVYGSAESRIIRQRLEP